jgi:hypothetical protein
VRERIKRHLCNATGRWTADYVRLQFAAHPVTRLFRDWIVGISAVMPTLITDEPCAL